MPGKNQTANPDLSWLNHVKLVARHADRAQQMPYVLTKYSHKYVIYVTLLKKSLLMSGWIQNWLESYTESKQKRNNLEDVDPLLFNNLLSTHYTYAIFYVQFPFLSI